MKGVGFAVRWETGVVSMRIQLRKRVSERGKYAGEWGLICEWRILWVVYPRRDCLLSEGIIWTRCLTIRKVRPNSVSVSFLLPYLLCRKGDLTRVVERALKHERV